MKRPLTSFGSLYFQRLTGLARQRLSEGQRRVQDEDDIALSVFKSLCERAGRGDLDGLDGRDELWRLLAITDVELFHMPVEKSRSDNPRIAFSPDGKRFALSCADWAGAIQIHDAASEELLGRLLGHGGFTISLQFSPDGSRLLSGSGDGTAKIWDLGSSRELLTLKGPINVSSAAFSPDGRTIFTGAYGSMGRLWEAATPGQVAAWEAEEASGAAQRAILQEALEKEQDAMRAAGPLRAVPRRRAIEQAMKAKLARPGDPALLASDPGAIRQWLALASPHSWHDAETQLDDEQIPDEARLRPRANGLVNFLGDDGGQRVWAPLQLEDYRLDFRTSIAANSGATVAYAVSYILSERDQTGLGLKVGSEYNAKIYLNQREIYRRVNPDTVEPDRDTVTGVELKAGLNVLVFKVVRMEMIDDLPWVGYVRFTTANGSPVQGITVTLDPDAKK